MKQLRILKQLIGGGAALFFLWRAWDSFATNNLLFAGLYALGAIAVALFTLDI